jgi:hypothetical protein
LPGHVMDEHILSVSVQHLQTKVSSEPASSLVRARSAQQAHC